MPTDRPAALTRATAEHPHHRDLEGGQTTKRTLGRTGPLFPIALAATILVALAAPAWAAGPVAPTLNSVIDALRLWLVGILAGLATLFLTIGGIRYLTAAGDPAQVERAKVALKSAAIGYALAALAPLLVSILRSVVGA
ncbi:MAG: pilin [Actinomycetes bacterium]